MERSLLLCNFKFFVEISKKSVFPLENVSKSQLWAIRKKLFLSSIFFSNIFHSEKYRSSSDFSKIWKRGIDRRNTLSLRLNSHVSTFDTLKGRGFYEIFNALANFYPFIDVSTRNFQFFNFFSYVWSL